MLAARLGLVEPHTAAVAAAARRIAAVAAAVAAAAVVVAAVADGEARSGVCFRKAGSPS